MILCAVGTDGTFKEYSSFHAKSYMGLESHTLERV